MSRFDYIEYDREAMNAQCHLKKQMQHIEADIQRLIKAPRAKALALTKLEEVYMWTGKGIRDDQIERNGTAPLQEKRNNE